MAKNKENNKWRFIIFVLLGLALLSFLLAAFASLFIEDVELSSGNVAHIPVNGVVMTQESSTMLGASISSKEIVKLIEKADKNPRVKAILIEIDSPGGTPVATDEVVSAVKKTNKTTVSWIRETGASGAYWIASASDHIVANRMSLTGSIGVLSSYLEFSGLLENYNVTYQRLVAGKYKDIGTPLKEITAQEEMILQDILDKIQEFFLEDVAKSRDLSEGQIEEISTGLFFLGSEAKELGLVDELGGKDEAIRFIENKHNITASPVEYERERSLLDVFGSLISSYSFNMGRGIGASVTEKTGRIII